MPLLLAVACETLPENKHSPAPLNACPANACAALDDGKPPVCAGGICAIQEDLPPLYVVVGLPTYSLQGPSMAFLLTANGAPPTSTFCNDALPACLADTCTLPPWQPPDNDAYAVTPNASGPAFADFNLDNPGQSTTLPVSTTYRLLIGPDLDDALDLGLPVVPYAAQHFETTAPFAPGPRGTAPFTYVAALPPGCYRRTAQPDAPLSSAFPPEIRVWPPGNPGFSAVSAFDPTAEENGLLPSPIFDISRAEGLDGWTAYLRNIKTGQVTSPVASLHGSLDKGVRLLTNHGGDVGVTAPGKPAEALAGLELVIAPPPGTPLPLEVLAPLAGELPVAESYPSFPTPLQVTGRVQTAAGVPVPAKITFTATTLFKPNGGGPFPSNSFEFTATTVTDARADASTYSVLLPQGIYQMVVRPTDGTNGMWFAVRPFASPADVAAGGDVRTIAPQARVSGVAFLADGRSVAEGLVEAIPSACPQPIGGVASPTPQTDAFCLPGAAQVMADDQGAFAMALDPGSYTLRVTPVQGTRFPWVTESLAVTTDDQVLPPIGVPAPVVFGRTIAAATGAATDAVVRVFTQPQDGSSPVELGRAITDGSGHFDVYIAPPSPSSSASPVAPP